MKAKATLKQIAKELNVSVSTVSKALNDSPEISEQTKTKIKEYAKLKNYKPNVIGLNLKNRKTKTIGVIIPDILNSFFAKVFSGIEKVADERGYNVIMCISNESLEKEITKLSGKKIIFTNGSKAHAANVTKRIGIEKLFDGVFDIVDSDFVPKPSKQPYEKIIENFKIEPQYCIFFEDIARNLKPAHELGMKTVWIENDEPWAAKYSDSEFINYKTNNLANFLKEINNNG